MQSQLGDTETKQCLPEGRRSSLRCAEVTLSQFAHAKASQGDVVQYQVMCRFVVDWKQSFRSSVVAGGVEILLVQNRA